MFLSFCASCQSPTTKHSYLTESSYPMIEGFSLDDFRSMGSKDKVHFVLNLDENRVEIEGFVA